MKITKPNSIIFDWDNTLVNTWPTIHRSFNITLKKMGKEEWTLEQTKERVHKSMRDSFPVIFGNEWEKAAEIYQSSFREVHIEMLSPLDRSQEVLEYLLEIDMPAILVSNKKGINLRKETAYLNWDKYFKSIIGAQDAKNDKPFRDPVDLAYKKLNIDPNSDSWFIGDTISDIECAYNCGVKGIFFGQEIPKTDDFVKFPPFLHLKNHEETLEILKKINE